MLKINDTFTFEDDWTQRQSCLRFFEGDDEEPASWEVDIGFQSGLFQDEEVSPSLSISAIYTEKTTLCQLVGETFSVETIEECYDREDTFYLFEHEPFVRYTLQILEIEQNKAHIQCSGIFVEDGYATPFTQQPFFIDSWVPIIQSSADWENFNL